MEELWHKHREQYLDLMDIISDLEQNGGYTASNFFQVNRETVTGILGASLTYLFLLKTWPSLEDRSVPDYLKGVCCFAFNDLTHETGINLNQVLQLVIRVVKGLHIILFHLLYYDEYTCSYIYNRAGIYSIFSWRERE